MVDQLNRFGSGVGIEIRGNRLRAAAVKSRPKGLTVLGARTIEDFRERPAAEWGKEYSDFLAECGMSHVAAAVCLPRNEVIVRQIQLPPMREKERAAAIRYQLDGLHPFADDEIYHAYVPLPQRSGASPVRVAVAIAEKRIVDGYIEKFEEAGVQAAAFTVSAAALFAALRLRSGNAIRPVLVADFEDSRLDLFGESEGRPALGAEFNLRTVPAERALSLAAAELRLSGGERARFVMAGEAPEIEAENLPADLEQCAAEEVFSAPLAAPADFVLSRDLMAFATAVEAACPRLGWRANLLPPERRKSDSRLLYAPTAALLFILALLGVGFLVRPAIQDRAYASAIEEHLGALQAAVAEAEANATETERVRRRIAALRELERRTPQDLAIVSELSESIPRTAWLSLLAVDDKGVQMTGETDAAAPLLGILNNSRNLRNAAFAASLTKIEAGERFQITAERRPADSVAAREAESAEQKVPNDAAAGEAQPDQEAEE